MPVVAVPGVRIFYRCRLFTSLEHFERWVVEHADEGVVLVGVGGTPIIRLIIFLLQVRTFRFIFLRCVLARSFFIVFDVIFLLIFYLKWWLLLFLHIIRWSSNINALEITRVHAHVDLILIRETQLLVRGHMLIQVTQPPMPGYGRVAYLLLRLLSLFVFLVHVRYGFHDAIWLLLQMRQVQIIVDLVDNVYAWCQIRTILVGEAHASALRW